MALIQDKMSPSLLKIQKELDKLPKQAYEVFLKNTPKKSGNARRHTKLQGDTIHADYDYATALDKGWSKQSPQGMTKPTEQFIKTKADKIVRK